MVQDTLASYTYPTPPFIKAEDSPSPPPVTDTASELERPQSNGTTANPPTASAAAQIPFDDKDPEGYLRKCAAYNKRTGKRCENVFGKGTMNSRNGINSNPEYLATCHSHKGQLFFAGRCQYSDPAGELCGRLFKWTKPYFQLCNEHMGHPDTPCYIMKLPLELRREIYRYLIPQGPIGSSTVPQHENPPFALHPSLYVPPVRATHPSFLPPPPPPPPPPPVNPHFAPMNMNVMIPANPGVPAQSRSFMSLLLINNQITAEVLDLLYGTIPFTIDIRKDGTFMCGRRLLEAKPAEGGPFAPVSASADVSLEKFLKSFQFRAVKNYHVDILVENRQETGPVLGGRQRRQPWWSEEVELYDLRDYVSVAVSGILAKATNLSRLIVRVGVSGFNWSEKDLISKLQTVVEPFTRLRKVVQPKLLRVYDGQTNNNYSWMMPFSGQANSTLYSVPRLPTQKLLLGNSSAELIQEFEDYKKTWERTISRNTPPPPRPPIRAMFSELKTFYTKLHQFIPDIYRSGQHSFLHRARVAREKEDVIAFREVRNELIGYWNQYLEEEEQKRDDMNQKMCRMLDVDSYPSEETEDEPTKTPQEPGSPDYLELLKAADDDPNLPAQRFNVRQLQRQLLIQRQMMFRMQSQAQAQAVMQTRQVNPATQQASMASRASKNQTSPQATNDSSSGMTAGWSYSCTGSSSSNTVQSSSSPRPAATMCKQVAGQVDMLSPLGNPDAILLDSPLPVIDFYKNPPRCSEHTELPHSPSICSPTTARDQGQMQIQQQYAQAQQRLAQAQTQQQLAQAQAQQQLAQAQARQMTQAQRQQLALHFHQQQAQTQANAQAAPHNGMSPFIHSMGRTPQAPKRSFGAAGLGSEGDATNVHPPMKRYQSMSMAGSAGGGVIGDTKGKGKAVFIEIDD